MSVVAVVRSGELAWEELPGGEMDIDLDDQIPEYRDCTPRPQILNASGKALAPYFGLVKTNTGKHILYLCPSASAFQRWLKTRTQ